MSYNLLLKTQNLKTRVRDSSGNPFVGLEFPIIFNMNLILQKIATDSPTEGNAIIIKLIIMFH